MNDRVQAIGNPLPFWIPLFRDFYFRRSLLYDLSSIASTLQYHVYNTTPASLIMFSVYILTYNEEIDIAACIESAQMSDDIIVIDSYSSDRTMEIASRYPVRVMQHAFETHGKQRTWMLQEVPTKYDWVYILEADERFTPELFSECLNAIKSQEFIGYYVAERVMFMDRWIRFSTQYPRCQMRLFRKDRVW